MAITTEQFTIKALFLRKETFVVPKYQRGYAWDGEAIDDFIRDLSECLSLRLQGKSKNHFFGGVVTNRKNISDSTRSNFEVIDGQQRLATFVLLISCFVKHIEALIKDIHENIDTYENEREVLDYLEKTKSDLIGTYITYCDNRGITHTDVPKLTLSEADKHFFQDILTVQHQTENRDSQRKIQFAYDEINVFLRDRIFDPSETPYNRAIRINIFLEKVLDNDCTVIFMCSDTPTEAYQIFQVLNDRGVQLGKGDLLRARTLELMDGKKLSSLQDIASRKWDDILAYDADIIEKYFLWYFSSVEGRRPRPVELVDEYLRHRFKCIDKNPLERSDAKIIISELDEINSAFLSLDKLCRGDWPLRSHDSVNKWDGEQLSMLVTHLNHTNAMPLLLSLIGIGPKKFAEAVSCLNRFVFRYKTIVNAHATPMTNVYLKHARDVRFSDQYSINSLRNDFKRLIDDYAPDAVFEAALKEIRYLKNRGNTYIRYFFISIEDYGKWLNSGAQGVPKCKNKSIVCDIRSTTIEHIYPLNSIKENKDENVEPVKDTLGNLTILDPEENDSLANRSPSEKLIIFRSSKFNLNKTISENEEWTRTIVENRTELLSKIALKIFVP